MRVAVLDDYQQAAHHFADWQSLDAEVTFLHEHIASTEELAQALRGYEVVVAMRERTPFSAERFEQLPDLRLLVTTGMANASIDLAAAERHGVTVCGTQSPATATPELTWGLILSLLRHIPAESTGMREGQWQHSIGGDLYGRTLGVVGLGRLGSRVAAVGRAFGMRVLAWSSNLEPATARERGAEPVSKETLFSEADIVTLHYKLSERSRGLVGAQELSWMKPTAYLVNTSRGPLIDTDALVDALTVDRRLQGYAHLPAARGDLLAKLGRTTEARAAFEAAAALTRNEGERAVFLRRAEELA